MTPNDIYADSLWNHSHNGLRRDELSGELFSDPFHDILHPGNRLTIVVSFNWRFSRIKELRIREFLPGDVWYEYTCGTETGTP